MTGAPMSPGSQSPNYSVISELMLRMGMDGEAFVVLSTQTDQPQLLSVHGRGCLYATPVGYVVEPNTCSCKPKD